MPEVARVTLKIMFDPQTYFSREKHKCNPRLPHPLYPYPINLMNVDLGVQCLQRICNISLYLLSIISRHPDFITF